MDYPWPDEEEWYEEEIYELYDEAAHWEYSGGCLTSLLPPFSVVLVSCVLAFFALNITSSPVVAISFNTRDSAPAEAQTAAEQPAASTKQSETESKTRTNNKPNLAPLFTDEIQYWGDKIVKWSKKYGIDPNLTATVMQIESCGDPQARSSAGASGLFQVMPYHFASGEDPFDPQTNAARGLAYLVQALDARSGDTRLALASYNGGISGAARPESQWAAETQRYAYWGDGIYQDAVQGKKKSSRLDEWLNAGGAGLCTQASSRLGLNP
jgi:hypothetical protein